MLKMGSYTSKVEMTDQILNLLKQQGTEEGDNLRFCSHHRGHKPLDLAGRGEWELKVPDWEQVKLDLQRELQKRGQSTCLWG